MVKTGTDHFPERRKPEMFADVGGIGDEMALLHPVNVLFTVRDWLLLRNEAARRKMPVSRLVYTYLSPSIERLAKKADQAPKP